MQQQNKVTGVVLAGGLARRMNKQDKGLIIFRNKAMVSYALEAMARVAETVLINANRNLSEYRQFGYQVISDQTDTFDGPLAGVLAAMTHAQTNIICVIPCDSPLIKAEHLQKLITALTENIDIAVAFDGERMQPVFFALKKSLQASLQDYLQQGNRKIDVWLEQHRMLKVDFSQDSELFLNINTLSELQALEKTNNKPEMTDAGLSFSKSIIAVDEMGNSRQIELVGERALTLYVDKQEIVTLMTMGTHPELLTLGYLKNQGFFEQINEIKIVQVDWETEAVAVVTNNEKSDFSKQMEQRTVTTGCGQGTVFGRLMDKLKGISVPKLTINQSTIYALLDSLKLHNEVYKKAGAVHGCALCTESHIDFFVEDVGRHNAVDSIAGYMWLNNISGENKIFYTTGRLTSEMVIKVSQMGIPVLLSRSGATQMGLDMAKQSGVTLISRAKGKHFMVLNGVDNMQFDAGI
jgi:FdhD protein